MKEKTSQVHTLRKSLIRKSARRRPTERAGARRVVIVGLPNSGKSQLFNDLTGGHELVANYPLTTMEVKSRECVIDGEPFEIVDTPGLRGLYMQSDEERAARACILSGAAGLLVQCIDANRLKESLLLTADLVDLNVPIVLVLTAVGESTHRGIRIDAAGLSAFLGVPVAASEAPGKGIDDVRRALLSARIPSRSPDLGPVLETAVRGIQRLLPPERRCSRAIALLLLEGDPTLAGADLEAMTEGVERIRSGLTGKAPRMLGAMKSQWVDDIAERVSAKAGVGRPGFSETFARLCRHPVLGLPILGLFLCVIYLMVVYVAGNLSLLLTMTITDPVVSTVGRLLPDGFFKDLFIGPHGLLTLGLFNSLTTVLPILSVFFLVFGTLEDVGYLPNLAVLTRRVSEKIGLTGNAIIPLVLGFGCKTMATMTARTLASRKEKVIVITLIAFAVPCSAQMGLSIAILGQHGLRYFVVAFACLAAAEVVAGLLLNRLIPEDIHGRFMQELPPIRAPRPYAVLRKTGYRLVWFLREAIPIFLVASLAMFAIDKLGVLAALKQALRPVITGLFGLPMDMLDALLLTLARSEAAAGLIYTMARDGILTGTQSIIAIVLLTTFAQCFANIAAMFKEVGVRTAIIIVISIYAASFLFTGAVHGFLMLAGGVLRL
jgi:ferrous iron transport protein B